jgi:hypothetical protein
VRERGAGDVDALGGVVHLVRPPPRPPPVVLEAVDGVREDIADQERDRAGEERIELAEVQR